MPLPEIPYDEWFDPNYKYNPDPDEEMDLAPSSVEPQDESDDIENIKSIHEKMYKIATSKYNPDEEMDLAPSSVEPQDEEETMHEKAYKIATSKYNPFSIGGSENIHDFDRKD